MATGNGSIFTNCPLPDFQKFSICKMFWIWNDFQVIELSEHPKNWLTLGSLFEPVDRIVAICAYLYMPYLF